MVVYLHFCRLLIIFVYSQSGGGVILPYPLWFGLPFAEDHFPLERSFRISRPRGFFHLYPVVLFLDITRLRQPNKKRVTDVCDAFVCLSL